MINLNIKIGKKETIFLSSILMAFVITGLAIAYGGNNPSVVGHSSGEIDIQKNGITMSLQQAITSKEIYYPDKKPEEFHLIPGTASDCYQADISGQCDDSDGCTIKYFIQNEGYDMVYTEEQTIFMEGDYNLSQGTSSNNNNAGTSGHTESQNTSFDWVVNDGTGNLYTLWDIDSNKIKVLNYFPVSCSLGKLGKGVAFNSPSLITFQIDPTVNAKVIIYD